jgi:serine protease Do
MQKKISLLIFFRTFILFFFLFVHQPYLNSQEEHQPVFSSRSFDASKTLLLEHRIQKIYKKVLKSTVTINNRATGVLISQDGYILTAAHVVLGARKDESSITMSNGDTYTAKHLGKDIKGDYALMKIVEKGTWDYLELGSSSHLGNDEACLMFGHSEGYQPDRPALMRIGFYKGAKELGFLKTSCIMMPGDSGGPLVDLDGKVIGVCSHIAPSMKDNFYAPVDPVKENWEKLIKGETFNLKKPKENQFPKNNKAIPSIITEKPFSLKGGKESLINSITKSAKNIHKSVVKIKSTINDVETTTYGTIINSKGYIVAKASQINQDQITCKLYNGTTVSATIVGIDEPNDLVVIHIAEKKLSAIHIPKKTDGSVGKLIGTASFKEGIKYAGVISVPVRSISAEPVPNGFLGASLTFGNRIFGISDNGAAMLGGLKRDDVIIKFNDTKIENSDDRISFLATTKVDQKLKVTVLREGKEEEVHVTLLQEDPQRRRRRHIAYDIDISDRKGGFTEAFTHDMPIEAYETGTPVVDIYGDVIGINIAKENRTSSFAIPINIVLETVKKMELLYSAKL